MLILTYLNLANVWFICHGQTLDCSFSTLRDGHESSFMAIYIYICNHCVDVPIMGWMTKTIKNFIFWPKHMWLCLGPLNPMVNHHGSHFLRAPFWGVYSLPSLYPLTGLPLWSRPEEGCWLIYMFSCSVWYVFQQYHTEHVYNLYHVIIHNKPQHHNYVEYGL